MQGPCLVHERAPHKPLRGRRCAADGGVRRSQGQGSAAWGVPRGGEVGRLSLHRSCLGCPAQRANARGFETCSVWRPPGWRPCVAGGVQSAQPPERCRGGRSSGAGRTGGCNRRSAYRADRVVLQQGRFHIGTLAAPAGSASHRHVYCRVLPTRQCRVRAWSTAVRSCAQGTRRPCLAWGKGLCVLASQALARSSMAVTCCV